MKVRSAGDHGGGRNGLLDEGSARRHDSHRSHLLVVLGSEPRQKNRRRSNDVTLAGGRIAAPRIFAAERPASGRGHSGPHPVPGAGQLRTPLGPRAGQGHLWSAGGPRHRAGCTRSAGGPLGAPPRPRPGQLGAPPGPQAGPRHGTGRVHAPRRRRHTPAAPGRPAAPTARRVRRLRVLDRRGRVGAARPAVALSRRTAACGCGSTPSTGPPSMC